MIPVNKNIISETGGIDQEVGFTVKASNLGTLFHILRSQLYSNPILAVIREYSCNAQDAHAAVGKPTLPIRITLPTMLESFYKIRDFGTGLDAEEIKEIFSSYGESTKRNTNDQTGMLGIGCKSAFAYTDSFIVNSYKNGKMESWSAFLDPSQQGKMAMLASDTTTEPDGIEIVVAVKTADMEKFKNETKNFFTYFNVLPDLCNMDSYDLQEIKNKRDVKGSYSGTDWKLLNSTPSSYTTSFAVMGNIAYPIDGEILADKLCSAGKEMLKFGLIIQVQNGSLEFAASREALQYTPQTKKVLVERINAIAKEIEAIVTKEFANCKTLWESKCLYVKLFTSWGKLYNLRNMFPNGFTFNGKLVNGGAYSMLYRNMSLVHYSEQSNRLARTAADNLPANEGICLVENDTNICNLIAERFVGPIRRRQYSYMYLVRFGDAKAKAEWLTKSGYDGPIISLGSLPRESISSNYPNMVLPNKGVFNKKHLVKEFELDVLHLNTNRSGNASEFWKEIAVAPDTATGIYLELERFEYKVDTYHGAKHPRDLASTIDVFNKLGIKLPIIYGFKRSSAEKAQKNKSMTPFFAWVKATLTDYFKKNPQIEQQYLNYLHLNDQMGDVHEDLFSLARTCLQWKNFPKNDLHAFFKKIMALEDVHSNLKDKDVIAKAISLSDYQYGLRPNVDFKTDYDSITQKYPMFMLNAKLCGVYKIDRDVWQKAAIDYLKLVDNQVVAVAPTPMLAHANNP